MEAVSHLTKLRHLNLSDTMIKTEILLLWQNWASGISQYQYNDLSDANF